MQKPVDTQAKPKGFILPKIPAPPPPRRSRRATDELFDFTEEDAEKAVKP